MLWNLNMKVGQIYSVLYTKVDAGDDKPAEKAEEPKVENPMEEMPF